MNSSRTHIDRYIHTYVLQNIGIRKISGSRHCSRETREREVPSHCVCVCIEQKMFLNLIFENKSKKFLISSL